MCAWLKPLPDFMTAGGGLLCSWAHRKDRRSKVTSSLYRASKAEDKNILSQGRGGAGKELSLVGK